MGSRRNALELRQRTGNKNTLPRSRSDETREQRLLAPVFTPKELSMAKDEILIGTTDEGTAVKLDLNKLIDSRMLIEGNSGSGKSWLLRLLLERVAGRIPFIVIDPEGEFASLREKVDCVLVGSEGDIPADLRSAALLARKLVELRVSAILDVYDLKPQDRRLYVKYFLDALINLPRELWTPYLVPIDEVHKFAPEKGQGDNTATDAVLSLMSLGRKRGFCGIPVTTRFSKLHNDVIAETNNVFIGRTWMDADVARAGKYLGFAPKDYDKLRVKPGNFFCFGPAMLHDGIVMFKSDKVSTTHPKAGERHKIKPPKASEAISHIVSQIDDLPEIAEQEAKDLASVKERARRRETELTTQIHALERELKNAAKPVIEKEPVMVFPEAKLTELQDLIDDYFKPFSLALEAAETKAEKIESLVLDLRKAMPPEQPEPKLSGRPMTYLPKPEDMAVVTKAVRQVATERSGVIEAYKPKSEPSESNGNITGLQQRIINGLAEASQFGVDDPDRKQLGFFIGTDLTGGTGSKSVAALRDSGIVECPPGRISLTEHGKQYSTVSNPPVRSRDELHKRVRDHLAGLELRILDHLLPIYPNQIHRKQLGEILGTDLTGGTGSKTVRRLVIAGIVLTPQPGMLKAADALFPESLN
jgi:hypothetical protein